MSALNPQMETILSRTRAGPQVDLRAMPILQARAQFEENARYWNRSAPAVASVRELTIPTEAGAMRARLYLPSSSPGLPAMVYAHGGGWTFGSLDTHDGEMRGLALASGCAVLGLDYRLAPEHPFPAGLHDLLTALRFVESDGLEGDVDPARLAVAGDSAGANLALAALLSRRDAGEPPLRAGALFYGCYAPDFDTESHARFGDGSYLLATASMQWYWRNFLGDEPEGTTGLAAPLRADLSGLPPLYLAAAGLDPLRDDTLALGARLASADTLFRLDSIPGVVHGFLRMAGELNAARDTIAAGGAFIAAHTKKV